MAHASGRFFCTICVRKSFTTKGNFKLHVQTYHPDKLNDFFPPKAIYNCETCSKRFKNNILLNKHRSNHVRFAVQCPLCTFCDIKSVMIDHFNSVHDVILQIEKKEFATIEEFKTWKTQIEEKETVSFIAPHGTHNQAKHSRTVYSCHRSGLYKGTGHGHKQLKSKGSRKINGFCPASMTLVHKNAKYSVEYTSTHVGHTNDLCHINISQNEKVLLAKKLADNVPLNAILDDVRDSVVNTKSERIHLLTKQDLRNIKRSFNLHSSSLLDGEGIDLWARKMADIGCILFYKPQKELSAQCPFLREEDFILIIMNKGQLEMLLEYSTDCVCVDRTHDVNAYGFELHTLMILDNLSEGFPCAFLITNRSDEQVYTLFFSLIKEKYMCAIESKVFMSDLDESYYKAWVQVMGATNLRLYCTWHVDHAWRKSLNKIHSKEKQPIVYKRLRVLLHETDVVAFTEMIQQFVKDLMEDEDTKAFVKQFQKLYLSDVSAWAYCYQINTGLNVNVHLERMHSTIQYLYLNAEHTGRLDICICAIMKFVRDKLFGAMSDNRKVTSKIHNLIVRHVESEKLDLKSVSPIESGGFDVSDSNDIYSVKRINSTCNCKLLCKICNICIHVFTCTCIDYSVQWNMCKHIHLVQKYKETHPECCTASLSSDDEEVHDASSIADCEERVEQQFDLDALRTRMEEVIEKINTVEEYDSVMKSMDSFLSRFRPGDIDCNSIELCIPPPSVCANEQSRTKKRKLNTEQEDISYCYASLFS